MATEGTIINSALVGTVSGTALTVVVNIGSQDIIKTVILAAVGAVVSFWMSVLLKWLVKRFRR